MHLESEIFLYLCMILTFFAEVYDIDVALAPYDHKHVNI